MVAAHHPAVLRAVAGVAPQEFLREAGHIEAVAHRGRGVIGAHRPSLQEGGQLRSRSNAREFRDRGTPLPGTGYCAAAQGRRWAHPAPRTPRGPTRLAGCI